MPNSVVYFPNSPDRNVSLCTRVCFNPFFQALKSYYSLISDFDFNQILSLCFSNKDFFNREIKQLSYDFYSLYLCMDVVNRMMCIWHLSYSSYMDDGLKKDERVRLKKMFYDDNEFVTPMQSSGEITVDKRKKLSKYFKMDN